MVFNEVDEKLYRYTAEGWTAALAAADLTGQITETQIEDDAISTPKIAAGAVLTKHLEASAITTAKLDAGAVTAAKLASTELITVSAQIRDALIVNAKIGDLEVDTIKIKNNSVTAASAMSASGNLPKVFSLTHQPRSAESTLEVTLSGIVDVPAGSAIRALADLYIADVLVAAGIRLGKNNQSNTYSLTRLAAGSSSPVTVRFETTQDGTSVDGPGYVDCTIIIKEFKR